MARFHYVRPGTLEAALAAMKTAGPSVTVLAGGTDVLVRLRSGHLRPAVVVDVKRAVGLESGVASLGSMLRIGARCTMTELLADTRIRQHFPALVEAARVVGSVQIRNRATLAGNICNASPAADTAPALLAYGALVNISGSGGLRRVPLSKFFVGPGKTVLTHDELVTSIDLPLPSAPAGAAFMRLTRRRGVDLATLTVCCAIAASGDVRVALGAVAPTPLLVSGMMLADLGQSADEQQQAIAWIASHANPIGDVRAGLDYRSAMLPIFIGRALDLARKRVEQQARWQPPESRS